MLDVLKSIGFEYLAATCASSFKGLHESVVNYGKNVAPEFLTTTHEETSVALAHGYAKIENKPLLVCAHGTWSKHDQRCREQRSCEDASPPHRHEGKGSTHSSTPPELVLALALIFILVLLLLRSGKGHLGR